jgi:hypothetical protein
MTRQKHIFVSYAREDRRFVQRLTRSLRESGRIPWQDLRDLRGGDPWQVTIDEALRKAEALIVVISPKATLSQYVTYEWAFALGAGIKVIPVIVKKRTNPHPRLTSIHHIDFTTGRGTPWVSLRAALPKLKIKTSAGPEIRAKFNMAGSKPEKQDGYYVINVYINNAPRGADQVTYEFHDETLQRAKWLIRSAASDFKSTILSNGDSLLNASIRTPSKRTLHIASSLHEALKRGHGSTPKQEVTKAINQIGASKNLK